jgi:Arc/MetJ family transcription regulator
MRRTNIVLDERLVGKARRLTRLKTKRAVVHRALETLVRTESRKRLLEFYGSGIWKGNLRKLRRDRA